MSQFPPESDFSPRRRASSPALVEQRAVALLIRPYVRQFDGWTKEAAFLGALYQAQATTEVERRRLAMRFGELSAEVEAALERFRLETASISHASRVIDLGLSFEALLKRLGDHGAP